MKCINAHSRIFTLMRFVTKRHQRTQSNKKSKLTVTLGEESRVVISTATGVLAEYGERCEVCVLAREQVGVHRDLHATELDRSRLVEPNNSKEKERKRYSE